MCLIMLVVLYSASSVLYTDQRAGGCGVIECASPHNFRSPWGKGFEDDADEEINEKRTCVMDHKHLEKEVVGADRDDIKPSGWFPWMTVAFLVFVVFLGFLKYADAADGVIEINQARVVAGGITASDTPGFPATLDAAGHYVLTGQLTVPDEDTHGIEVTAANVMIDLNGFSISGPVTCFGEFVTCTPVGIGNGVLARLGVDRTVIRNGIVKGMGRSGILVRTGSSVEDIEVTNNRLVGIEAQSFATLKGNIANVNGGDGINVGAFSIVNGNTANENGHDGISAGEKSTVSNNITVSNRHDGILAENGSQVTLNTSGRNGQDGIDVGPNSTVARNLVTRNGDDGIQAGVGSTLSYNSAMYNGDDGISVLLGSTLTGNILKNNDQIELSLLASEAGS